MKECMIGFIKQYQHYEEGTLEAMSEEEVKEIYEMLINFVRFLNCLLNPNGEGE